MKTNHNQYFLHVHSMYSLHDSAQSPDEIVQKVKSLGGKCVTLTDHGTLLGIEPFMKAGEVHHINTIPGVETYLENKTHMILFARNYQGYQAISYAMREANTNIEANTANHNLTYPIMTKEMLQNYFAGNENVVATSACMQGPLGWILLTNWRIQKQIDKNQSKCKQCEPAYRRWQELDAQYKTLTADISADKKERTTQKKYTTDAYLRKLEKEKKELEQLSKQDAAYQKKLQQYQYDMQIHEAAKSIVQKLDRTINLQTKQKSIIQHEKDTLRTAKERYKKLEAKKQSLQLFSQEDLLQRAKKVLLEYKAIFPHFYIELQYHGVEEEAYVMPILAQLAKETDTPVIAANDVHILDNSEESVEARRIMRFNYFKKAQTVSDADRMLYFKTDEELHNSLCQILSEDVVDEAIDNLKILGTCHVEFPKETHYPVAKDSTSFDSLLEQARLEKMKQGCWDQAHEERLRYEIQIIKQMGFVDYHLIVRDLCNQIQKLGVVPQDRIKDIPQDFTKVDEWLEENQFTEGIGKTAGRGSAVGSLVCYLLGITDIDPLQYHLYFERFLNPERVTMPDIDTDVKTSLRPTIIRYAQWKFGERAVSSIATEMTYGAKAAIEMAGRDRASQLNQHLGKKQYQQNIRAYLHQYTIPLKSMIPQDDRTLSSYEDQILPQIQDNAELMILWNHAKLIEGRLSGTSVHAGGIVISDNDNLNDYIPVAWNQEKQTWAVQCDMVRVEERGLLKLDLLGLRTCDRMTDTLHLIKKHRGISIDLNQIPFEAEVFQEIFSQGRTNSIFQCESDGMKAMMKQFQPSSFDDLILLIAAYRPGPMKYINDIIIPTKHGQKHTSYHIPMLEPILKDTYGAIIYQEQVMEIFQKLAGYSLGAADLVRRAMSKKKSDKLEIERKAFVYGDVERNIKGCVNNGIEEQDAVRLFDDMMDFASYAFNKSHATSYAFVAYQTAWLKYHFPLEFMCAMFNNKDQKEFGPLYESCRSLNIRILPPDINHSYYDFVIENNALRYGFKAIKGIGNGNLSAIQYLIQSRQEHAYKYPAEILAHLWSNTATLKEHVPKDLLLQLINAGCYDSLSPNREDLVAFVQQYYNCKAEDFSHFVQMLKGYPFKREPNKNYSFQQEMDLLGQILSDEPLALYQNDELYGCVPYQNLQVGGCSIMGFVIQLQKTVSAKGNDMALVQIQMKQGQITAIAMGQAITSVQYFVQKHIGKVFKFHGTYTEKGGFFIRTIQLLSPVVAQYYLTVTKQEEISIVNRCINPKSPNKYIPLTICCYWLMGTNGLYYTERPMVTKVLISNAELDDLRKTSIPLIKQ